MKRLTALLLGAMTLASTQVRAQSANDAAGWAALTFTPIGALAPMVVVPAIKPNAKATSKESGVWGVQAAEWSPSGGDAVYNLAGNYMTNFGENAIVAGTLGFIHPSCSGCSNDVMLGGDVNSAMWERETMTGSSKTALSVLVKGSLGFSHNFGSSGGNSFSLAGTVPLVYRMQQATGSTIGFFFAPGFGFGRISGSGSSLSGSRPIMGGGVSYTTVGGTGFHLGAQQIIIDGGSTNFGFAVTFRQ